MLFAIGDHCASITTAYRKGTGPIFETAEACRKAKESLSEDDKRLLLNELPFSAGTFSKYLSIAYDKRLNTEELRSILPPKFSVLYQLSQLNDEQYKAFTSQRRITTDIKRSEIESWRKKQLDLTSKRGEATSVTSPFNSAEELAEGSQGEGDAPASQETTIEHDTPSDYIEKQDLPLPALTLEDSAAIGLAVENETFASRGNGRSKCTITIEATGLETAKQQELLQAVKSIAAKYSLDVKVSPEFLAICMAEAA